MDVESLFFLEGLRKQVCFLASKKCTKLFKSNLHKNLSYCLKFFIDFSFLKKNKRLLSNIKNSKYLEFFTMLTFYRHYVKKDLVVFKFINKFKNQKKKLTRLLYALPLDFFLKTCISKKKKRKADLKLNRVSVKSLLLFFK